MTWSVKFSEIFDSDNQTSGEYSIFAWKCYAILIIILVWYETTMFLPLRKFMAGLPDGDFYNFEEKTHSEMSINFKNYFEM